MRFGRESRNGIGRPAAAVRRAVGLGLACAGLLGPGRAVTAQPANGTEAVRLDGREYALAVGRHRGYAAVPWSAVPREIIASASVAGSRGSGATPWGAPVEVRAGSPFALAGSEVISAVNEPYLEGGELWVPVTLLERAARLGPPDDATSGTPAVSASPGNPSAPAGSGSSGSVPRPVRRVMIDPGHGGHDPGTVNRRTGAREKDIVLAVSRYLAEELERREGVKAQLTRDDDRFIPLKQRPKMARGQNADLFLSVHVNAEPGRGTTARGFETYYLAPARNDESARVARLENSVLELEGEDAIGAGDDGIDKIVAMITRDGNRDVSGRLGGFVQDALRGTTTGPDRGVKPGPFWVLVGATGHMPAVLVELGFITNSDDEKRLTSKTWQKETAKALADAVERYLDDYEGTRLRLEGAG